SDIYMRGLGHVSLSSQLALRRENLATIAKYYSDRTLQRRKNGEIPYETYPNKIRTKDANRSDY
ncbi:MAG TPA: hypothetical protein VGD98_25555, partial [Ktedonobacteraceae bacterium]